MTKKLPLCLPAAAGMLLCGLFLFACAPSSKPPAPTTPPPTAAETQTEDRSPTDTPPPDLPVTSPPEPGGADDSGGPYAPQPGDGALQSGQVFIETQDVLTLESFPPQFVLRLTGALPTPCHRLRIRIDPPDSGGQLRVGVYSLVDPNAICTQVLQSFEASTPLRGLKAGKYSVVVNDTPVAEIAVP